MIDLSVLHDMTLFVEIARTGSFSRASESLGVPGATLSRRIAAMERDCGVRLFDRTTRSVKLTEAGRRYFERCDPLVDEARLAHEALREDASQLSGHVRLSVPVDFGLNTIGPLLPEFAQLYPGITFDIDLSSHHVDLANDGVDLAIRLRAVLDDKLVARQIGWIEQALYASPEYLVQHGTPTQPRDLSAHQCIVVRCKQRHFSWQLQRGTELLEVGIKGRFIANNIGLMRLLAERGMGVAELAVSLVGESVAAGHLVRVLPEWSVPAMPIYVVMASRLQSASVRAMLDFLVNRLVVN